MGRIWKIGINLQMKNMKKILFTLLVLATTLPIAAQTLNVKAIIIHKNDGNQDTIIWKNAWGYSYDTDFYGKEYPMDDDYIKLDFTISSDYQLSFHCYLTPDGEKAPCTQYGILFSSNHIDNLPLDSAFLFNYNSNYYTYKNNSFYYIDKKEWEWGVSASSNSDFFYLEPTIVYNHLSLKPGQTYYARAYYILDNNTFFSSEIPVRAPKTIKAAKDICYVDYGQISDSVIFNIDATNIILNNLDLFGNNSGYKQKLLKEYVSKVMNKKKWNDIQSMISEVEKCDDGNLFVINEIPSEIIDETIKAINNELHDTYYLQANPYTIYKGSPTPKEFGTWKCQLTMISGVDEKWGIQGNQYLCTLPEGTIGKPYLAFMLNHLMRPEETYNVKITFAPNTYDESDMRNTELRVYLASLKDDGSVPTIEEAKLFVDDTLTVETPMFMIKPHELKTINIRYKATSFTNQHFLQLMHIRSFTSAANRSKYNQIFRIVGIEVEPTGNEE